MGSNEGSHRDKSPRNRELVVRRLREVHGKGIGGYCFISSASALADKPFCLSRDQYLENLRDGGTKGFIEFVSLQDLKGSIEFGGEV